MSMDSREASALPKTTVLVIDDEPAVRKLARRVIEGQGLEVVSASDGVEALALFRTRSGDIGCVLLDASMPRLSGAETFVALQALKPGVPVILTSGHDEGDALVAFRANGPRAFLQKPFAAEDLLQKLGEALAAR
jgi:CheY-like chemotaxis protein